MRQIKQILVSPSVSTFQNQLLRKYNLINYHNKNKPAFFFGCYKTRDIDIILQHKELAIIIWCGTDAWKLANPDYIKTYNPLLQYLKIKKNIKHISMSAYIDSDLQKYKIPFKRIPICPTEATCFEPLPLGTEIYSYAGAHGREEFYGVPMVHKLQKIFPDIKFHILHSRPPNHVSPSEVKEIYKKCFLVRNRRFFFIPLICLHSL